jgi:nitrite reductase/ring-hydroxylating ferredoxin subunit
MPPPTDALPALVRLGRRDALRPNTAVARVAGGCAVALFDVGGRLYALDDGCLRCCASLAAGGTVAGTRVSCTCGWAYDLATGTVVGLPRLALDVYDATVDGEDIVVTLGPAHRSSGRPT